jgi:xanthine dehydrogenase YagS FAD-binding subunit
MKAFEYAAPTSTQDALEALSGSEALALSGGTDLLGRMKDYVTSPDRVVYLKDVKDLCGIDEKDGGLVIRAGTRLVEILGDKQIAKLYPALRQATLGVGTPQIRNMATLGGNLCQRPRCWYYRNGLGLLGMKDGKSLVRDGDNRYHAIFLTDGNALFTSPSSLAVPLIALGARATILGAKGERTLPVEDLYQVPKRDQDRELTIAPGELLLKVTIPAPRGKNASYEVRQKQSHDWPLVLCSVNLETDGGKVGNGRVVLYGVAPTPWRSKAAEEALRGKELNRETAEAAAEAAVKDAKPLSMNGYKVPLTKTVVQRALLTLADDRYWEEA